MRLLIKLIWVSSLFISCSKAELEPLLSNEYKTESKESAFQLREDMLANESITMRKQREAVSVLIKYLRLDGTRYFLDITESEAEGLGVAPEIYKNLIEQLETENEAISKAIKQGADVKLSNPQEQLKRYNDEQLRKTTGSYIRAANSQYSFSGRITTSGQEQGSTSFRSTYATNFVTFRCGTQGGALIAAHTCSVSAHGTTNTETRWSAPFCVPVIELPVVASGSGIIVNLTYQTSCPGGGYAVWLSN